MHSQERGDYLKLINNQNPFTLRRRKAHKIDYVERSHLHINPLTTTTAVARNVKDGALIGNEIGKDRFNITQVRLQQESKVTTYC